jgi:hypothetical protein
MRALAFPLVERPTFRYTVDRDAIALPAPMPLRWPHPCPGDSLRPMLAAVFGCYARSSEKPP